MPEAQAFALLRRRPEGRQLGGQGRLQLGEPALLPGRQVDQLARIGMPVTQPGRRIERRYLRPSAAIDYRAEGAPTVVHRRVTVPVERPVAGDRRLVQHPAAVGCRDAVSVKTGNGQLAGGGVRIRQDGSEIDAVALLRHWTAESCECGGIASSRAAIAIASRTGSLSLP